MSALSYTNRYAKPSNFGHPVRNPLLRNHYVYRAFNSAGELLYVGCSIDWKARLQEHKHANAAWVPLVAKVKLEGPYNYETARQVEYDAIESERPMANYTSERRTIDRLHQKVTDAHLQHLLAGGMDWPDAVHEAVEVADRLIPVRNSSLVRLDDLTVPSYRRAAADYIAALGGAA